MGEQATGLPKYKVKLESLTLPILKLIAEVIDPIKYKSDYSKARKSVIYSYLSNKNEHDAISFGCILNVTNKESHALLIPADKPYKYVANNDTLYSFKNLVEDQSNVQEEDLESEFWIIDDDRRTTEDYGTDTKITREFIKKVLTNREAYPQLEISFTCCKTSTKTEPNNVKFDVPPFEAENERNKANKTDKKPNPTLKTSTPFPNSTRRFIEQPHIPLPKLNESEEELLSDINEAIKRSKQDQIRDNLTNSKFSTDDNYEFINVRDQAKIKISLKTLGFDNLKNMKSWISDSIFSLDLAGVTDDRLRVSQLLANMNDSLKNIVIKKLSRNDDLEGLPKVNDVFDALTECCGNMTIDSRKSVEKFQINLNRPIIEQFYVLENILDRAYPGRGADSIRELAEMKLIEKLPRSISDESLFKYRDEHLETIELLEIIQKIMDGSKDSRSVNFLDKSTIVCYSCGKKGHRKADCRTSRKKFGNSNDFKRNDKYPGPKQYSNSSGFGNRNFKSDQSYPQNYSRYNDRRPFKKENFVKSKRENFGKNYGSYNQKYSNDRKFQNKSHSQSKPRFSGICSFCKIPGHAKETCFKFNRQEQLNYIKEFNTDKRDDSNGLDEFRGNYRN